MRSSAPPGFSNRTGFFLHIPFPPPDLFERLPWARDILQALLCFDVIGFQTRRDWRNFLDCVRLLRPTENRVHGDVVLSRSNPERPTRVGVHPISIEYSAFADPARSDAVSDRVRELREELGTEYVLLGVDRLDYTKGLPEKLVGFERALERFPELRGRVTLMQLIIPSRASIPEYHRLKDRIDRLVGRINGRFTRRGWAPIQYQYGSWTPFELLSFYRGADVALVTPLRDGMNLVSKEYVAASAERGVLVLSEFAGSAEELRDGALLVNPHDIEGMAEAIHRAVTLPRQEQRERMELMQAWVGEHDVHRWVHGLPGARGRGPRERGRSAQGGGALGRVAPVDEPQAWSRGPGDDPLAHARRRSRCPVRWSSRRRRPDMRSGARRSDAPAWARARADLRKTGPMTAPPRAARLLFPALRWSDETGFDHLEPEIAEALALGVGGFILFGGEAARVRALVDSLRRARPPRC